jgi:hypothetical protein
MTGSNDPYEQVLAPALAFGSANRNDLLSAAVSARAPTPVIQALLELPERNYSDIDDVLSVLRPEP